VNSAHIDIRERHNIKRDGSAMIDRRTRKDSELSIKLSFLSDFNIQGSGSRTVSHITVEHGSSEPDSDLSGSIKPHLIDAQASSRDRTPSIERFGQPSRKRNEVLLISHHSHPIEFTL